MTMITVIGIGSPYGVDSVAWQVIENLQQDHALQTLSDDRISFIRCDRPGAALIEYMRDKEYVILLDALLGGTPGIVQEYSKQQLLGLFKEQTTGLSSHDFGVAESIQLAEKLGAIPEKLSLLAIEVGGPSDLENFSDQQLRHVYRTISEYVYNTLSRVELTGLDVELQL